MADVITDGGPAFPVIGAPSAPEDYPGMSLRDYFAGQALATMKLGSSSWSDNPLYWNGVARSAYVCADAMLAARLKP